MTSYEVTYTLGRYTSSVLVQNKNEEDARLAAFLLIPQGAEITKVEQRG